ncbi:MAG: NAD(P)-binding protein, partial [Actinomycetales bacterium]
MPTTYILGAGPIGLAAAATLQRTTSDQIVVFEKRPAYT